MNDFTDHFAHPQFRDAHFDIGVALAVGIVVAEMLSYFQCLFLNCLFTISSLGFTLVVR